MYSSLGTYSHNNSFTIDISPEWEGQRSQKFGKTRRLMPNKDLIKRGLDLPDQTIHTGRSHYVNQYSPQYVFKRPKKQIQHAQYWHLRDSKIKTFDFKPTNKPPRRQMRHYESFNRYNPEHSRIQSLRTSNLQKFAWDHEYSVQQKMQRKVRVDSLQLRKSYYKHLNIFK